MAGLITHAEAIVLAVEWLDRAVHEAQAGVYLGAAASAAIGHGYAALAAALRPATVGYRAPF